MKTERKIHTIDVSDYTRDEMADVVDPSGKLKRYFRMVDWFFYGIIAIMVIAFTLAVFTSQG